MGKREKVTICIPHLMRENLLMRTLESVRKNVKVPHKTLIINDSKKVLSLPDIQVVNNLKSRGLGFARKQACELVDTKYLFFLDNDVVVEPNSVKFQMEELENNPDLGVVSGIRIDQVGRPQYSAADFIFVGKFIMRKRYSISHILAHKEHLFKADFVPLSNTTFRREIFKVVHFDPNYTIGFEHLDIFLQIYFTDWNCAVHKESLFRHLAHESSEDYRKIRFNKASTQQPRRYFTEKWGLVLTNSWHRTTGFGRILWLLGMIRNLGLLKRKILRFNRLPHFLVG